MISLLFFVPEDHSYLVQQVLLWVSLTVVASLLIHAWVWFVHHSGFFFLVNRNSFRPDPEHFEHQHPWRRPQRSPPQKTVNLLNQNTDSDDRKTIKTPPPVICPVPQRSPPLELDVEEESRRDSRREVGPSPIPVMGYVKDILTKLDPHIKTAYFKALQKDLMERMLKEFPWDQPLDLVHMGCVDVGLEEKMDSLHQKWQKRTKQNILRGISETSWDLLCQAHVWAGPTPEGDNVNESMKDDPPTSILCSNDGVMAEFRECVMLFCQYWDLVSFRFMMERERVARNVLLDPSSQQVIFRAYDSSIPRRTHILDDVAQPTTISATLVQDLLGVAQAIWNNDNYEFLDATNEMNLEYWTLTNQDPEVNSAASGQYRQHSRPKAPVPDFWPQTVWASDMSQDLAPIHQKEFWSEFGPDRKLFDNNFFFQDTRIVRDYLNARQGFKPHPSGRAIKNELGEVDIVMEGRLVVAPFLLIRAILKMPVLRVRCITKLLAQDRDYVTGEVHETWCSIMIIERQGQPDVMPPSGNQFEPEEGFRLHYFVAVTKPVLIEMDENSHAVLSNQWDFSALPKKRFAQGRARTISVDARRYAPVPDYVLGKIAMSGARKYQIMAENFRRSRYPTPPQSKSYDSDSSTNSRGASPSVDRGARAASPSVDHLTGAGSTPERVSVVDRGRE